MVVDSLFYSALRCTDVVFDRVVCFYFVYRHLFGRGHVLLTLQLHWL